MKNERYKEHTLSKGGEGFVANQKGASVPEQTLAPGLYQRKNQTAGGTGVGPEKKENLHSPITNEKSMRIKTPLLLLGGATFAILSTGSVGGEKLEGEKDRNTWQ